MTLIYDGKVDLSFGERDHRYLVSKKINDKVWTIPSPVLGCTSVVQIISKPQLMTYPMNKALEYLTEWVGKYPDGTYANLLKQEWPGLVRQARRAHVEHSNVGKKAGKVGHALVEALLLGKAVTLPTDPQERKYAESVATAFEAWKAEYKPKILGTEEAVYSLLHDVAGTYDLLCEIDGRKYIVDFKTTNPSYYNPDGIYAEYFCQLGGYLIAYEEQNKAEVDGAMIVNLPKDGSEFKVKSLEDIGKTITDAKVYFLSALTLYRSNRDFNG